MFNPEIWAQVGIGGLALLVLIMVFNGLVKYLQGRDTEFTSALKEINKDHKVEREADRSERKEMRKENSKSSERLAQAIDDLTDSLKKKG